MNIFADFRAMTVCPSLELVRVFSLLSSRLCVWAGTRMGNVLSSSLDHTRRHMTQSVRSSLFHFGEGAGPQLPSLGGNTCSFPFVTVMCGEVL